MTKTDIFITSDSEQGRVEALRQWVERADLLRTRGQRSFFEYLRCVGVR